MVKSHAVQPHPAQAVKPPLSAACLVYQVSDPLPWYPGACVHRTLFYLRMAPKARVVMLAIHICQREAVKGSLKVKRGRYSI